MNTLAFHRTVQLLDYYGPFLTEKQRKIMNDRYLNDFSLSEIAERLKITRSAVQDTIHKANAKLETFEEHLLLLDKQLKRKTLVDALFETELSEHQKALINTLKDVI